MTALLPIAAALLQLPATPPGFPVARLERTPAAAAIEVGHQLRLPARAFDAAGQPVPRAQIEWFAAGYESDVDSTGLVTGSYAGVARVAAVASIPGVRGQKIEFVLVRVLPEAPARMDIVPAPTRLVAGPRLTLIGTAFSRHGDPRVDLVSFSSGNPRVASVTVDGRLHAVAPGRAAVTAKAGPAVQILQLEVVPNTVVGLALEPPTASVRTGDVVRFTVSARHAGGRPVGDVRVEWALTAATGIAHIDPEGVFVAETPGLYTVTAALGGRTAEALVRVEQRRVTRGIEVRAHLATVVRTAEVWVHPSGRCLYLTTIADRVYAVSIADPASPRIVDSMMTDARFINDVMTTEDGRYGVFTREGASNRKNGIVIFDATEPGHPKTIAAYTETVSGGVHSSYVYQGRAYITDDATGSMRVIDIRDPAHPKEVARWEAQQTEAGRYLHDIMVVDGLAYLAYWNDGLIILDVGNGMKGGSPENPQLVSQLKYDFNATYARVEQL